MKNDNYPQYMRLSKFVVRRRREECKVATPTFPRLSRETEESGLQLSKKKLALVTLFIICIPKMSVDLMGIAYDF
ncbi:unnamed protein product [Leptosia nina]|uniref:Uncharacterized protein n=1 Tax=Leptosia nina TaxID=320188 RepID=A0AAV1JS21_9NEOP